MTREEEIIEVARSRAERHQIAEMELYRGDKCNYSYGRIYNSEIASFEAGAKWADEHPKSSWISVDDDLPCNHEELMSKYPFGYKKQTVNVLTFLPNGNVVKDSMGYREKWWNGRQWDGEKWEWESLRRPTHWVPIPKLPKE